jgi:hypothetical protein
MNQNRVDASTIAVVDNAAEARETPDGQAKPDASVEDAVPRICRLRIDSIRPDKALRMRVRLDDNAVSAYTAKYKRIREEPTDETPFPLCTLVQTHDGTLLLVDGWHRLKAMGAAGIEEADFQVFDGTVEEAALRAASANLSGVKSTQADKKHAVARLVEILGPQASSRRIAAACGLDHKTVERWRPKLAGPRVGRDGKLRKPPARPATPAKATPAATKTVSPIAEIGTIATAPQIAGAVANDNIDASTEPDGESTEADVFVQPVAATSRPPMPSAAPLRKGKKPVDLGEEREKILALGGEEQEFLTYCGAQFLVRISALHDEGDAPTTGTGVKVALIRRPA